MIVLLADDTEGKAAHGALRCSAGFLHNDGRPTNTPRTVHHIYEEEIGDMSTDTAMNPSQPTSIIPM